MRICFDAARRQGGKPSMNECVYKGPDRFINNLVAVLVGFMIGLVGGMCDITKMHNKVRLVPKDVHMQRFLWRFMKTDQPPLTLAVTVNNMGVSPANVIATSALRASAKLWEEKDEMAARIVEEQTYVDDILPSFANMEEAEAEMKTVDEILDHADMKHKGWTISGGQGESKEMAEDEEAEERALGMIWVPRGDYFKFKISIKLSGMIAKLSQDFPEVSRETLLGAPPEILTRRMVFSEVAKVFDPLGKVAPVLLAAKLLLKEAWGIDPKFGWDDPLPWDQVVRWRRFLLDLFDLEALKFERSLMPGEKIVGKPMLVTFSDGSQEAYGAASYIRWELEKGGFWTRLILAKSKIAQKGMSSIPRIELNGAILGHRLKVMLENHHGFDFDKVLNLVDSATVLGYLTRLEGGFKPYEGVRVAEIHSTGVPEEDGTLAGWGWIPGKLNPADYCTKPRKPEDLGEGSMWQEGPEFLRTPVEEWPVVETFKKLNKEILEEVDIFAGLEREVEQPESWSADRRKVFERIRISSENCASWDKLVGVWARMFHLPKVIKALKECPTESVEKEFMFAKGVKGRRTVKVTGKFQRDQYLPVVRKEDRDAAILEICRAGQEEILEELKKSVKVEWSETREKGVVRGRFKTLAPKEGKDGIWRVGGRMSSFVPFTEDNQMPVILPRKSRLVELLMKKAHEVRHGGQDDTLAEFRKMGFWAVRGGEVAKKVSGPQNCVTCMKERLETMQKVMGELPEEVLKQEEGWGFVQLDLFGPMWVRSDVETRKTTKVWGVAIEDCGFGAVHLDVLRDYSAQEVLVALRRFGSLRGWPTEIQTDPGSQLESAKGQLKEWWGEAEKALEAFAEGKSFSWRISPADSPWRQGRVEKRIGVIKRLVHIAIGDAKLSPLDLQTVLFEVADICNNRPISMSKPREDGSYLVLTPNHLIKGRSQGKMGDNRELAESMKYGCRYRVIQEVTETFWKRWAREVAPGRVRRTKWHCSGKEEIGEGDIVLICEPSSWKAKYKVAQVTSVEKSRDGVERRANLRYAIPRSGKGGPTHYVKPREEEVNRSVQRLALLLSSKESTGKLVLEEDKEGWKAVPEGQ